MEHRVTDPPDPPRRGWVNPKALERLRFGTKVETKEPMSDRIVKAVLLTGAFFTFLWIVIEAICAVTGIPK